MIGQRIKEFIENSGYSVNEIAEKAGVSGQNLYKIFQKDSIQTNLLVKLAAILDKPVTAFLVDDIGQDSLELDNCLNEVNILRKQVQILEDRIRKTETRAHEEIMKGEKLGNLCLEVISENHRELSEEEIFRKTYDLASKFIALNAIELTDNTYDTQLKIYEEFLKDPDIVSLKVKMQWSKFVFESKRIET
jgi:transcriptional regulator with XRE-family HTH domain